MEIRVKIFEAGYCTHFEKIVMANAPWRCCQFPALVALIQHPKLGNILFDTGYSHRFFTETKRFPFQLYRWITPVHYDETFSVITQLEKLNIKPTDIHYIFISHFHADHIAAIKDFPSAKFIYARSGYEYLHGLGKFAALCAGFISGLLPEDFLQRSIDLESTPLFVLPEALHPFTEGYDILGNKDLIAISLPGHANSQFGLAVKTHDHGYTFFVADACWTSEAFKTGVSPHWLAKLIMSDTKKYRHTLEKLNALYLKNPDIRIIPSHCKLARDAYE